VAPALRLEPVDRQRERVEGERLDRLDAVHEDLFLRRDLLHAAEVEHDVQGVPRRRLAQRRQEVAEPGEPGAVVVPIEERAREDRIEGELVFAGGVAHERDVDDRVETGWPAGRA
jgi:hypothetical protein